MWQWPTQIDLHQQTKQYTISRAKQVKKKKKKKKKNKKAEDTKMYWQHKI